MLVSVPVLFHQKHRALNQIFLNTIFCDSNRSKIKINKNKILFAKKKKTDFYGIQVIGVLVVKTLTSYGTPNFPYLSCDELCIRFSGLLRGGEHHPGLMSPL